ncbi:MAG: HAD-IB family hydrolase [Gammaproteobacteria bacterium]|nr:HAD-IB family hydrolase [Gammaproteobacteria bacterium]MCW8988129.1 HAD-IB family hydrolase [Gammaproteobacteria bacterium]MCW9030520.1 HAD-IB family hydrolase [Gammaproteobacteria bacterium]
MALAIFDLDNTLLDGDSDYLWGQFLAQQGYVDAVFYKKENQRFYDEYVAGTLDIFEFLEFSLKPLSQMDMDVLGKLHNRFMDECIRPIITTKSRALIQQHIANGDTLLIITATNLFITAPIAQELGIKNILATEPEIINKRYSGKVFGIPCFREGKVERLKEWLKETGGNLANSCFYSDSHNDLPLLEMVTKPIAVDPDDTLRSHAEMKGWDIMSLKD